jgi:hypothetical protein
MPALDAADFRSDDARPALPQNALENYMSAV